MTSARSPQMGASRRGPVKNQTTTATCCSRSSDCCDRFGRRARPEPDHGVREFTEAATWQVPAGIIRVTVELWGSGGGGAGGNAATTRTGPRGAGGGGGSAGAYVRTSLAVKPGQVYTIRVGAGGAGGRGEGREAAQPGADGQETALVLHERVVLSASGGRGGGAPKRGDRRGGGGGAGGGIAEATTTRLVRPGNPGLRGDDADVSEGISTSGGKGSAAVLGTVQPPWSVGGHGDGGMNFGYSDAGRPGGAGSVVITW
jgi:hypothetical protein